MSFMSVIYCYCNQYLRIDKCLQKVSSSPFVALGLGLMVFAVDLEWVIQIESF